MRHSLPVYAAGLLGVVLYPVWVCAQAPPQPVSGHAADPEVAKYEELAGACPAGMASDALLRLVELAPAEKASWKVAAVRRAFDLARSAEPRYSTRAVPVGFTDTVPAMSSISSKAVQVDSLSLQLRAVRAMLAYDSARSRDMFESILNPEPPPLTCKDLTVPDTRLYYEVLRAVGERSFAPSEIQKGNQEAFLANRALQITSPLQVFPVVGLLSEIRISAPARAQLVSAFAAALADIRGDDRSFVMGFLEDDSVGQLRTLVQRCQASGISLVAVVDALAKFYARQLAAKHCADTAQSEALQARLSEAVEGFNRIAQNYLPNHARLAAPPSGGPYDEPTVATDLWQKSLDYRTYLKRIEKSDGLSRDEAEELIHAIDSWSAPDGMGPREFFIIKSIVLQRALRDLTKDDHGYQVASEAYVRFLDSSVDERDGEAAVWLHSLLQTLKATHRHGAGRAEIMISALERSKNPALNLYAGLDRRVTALAAGKLNP